MKIRKILIMLFLLLLLEACTKEEILLQIQGTVTDATDNSLVTGAVVQFKIKSTDEGSPTLLAEVVTDENGFYYLKHLRKGNCEIVEDRFIITAVKTGPGYVYNSKTKSRVIYCIEEIQTVNFQLSRR